MDLKEVRDAHSSIKAINKIKDEERKKLDEKNAERLAHSEEGQRLYERLTNAMSAYTGTTTAGTSQIMGNT